MGLTSLRIAMVGQKGIPASYGGIERHVEELGLRLVADGHDVSVFCRPYYTKIRGSYEGMRLVVLPQLDCNWLSTVIRKAESLSSQRQSKSCLQTVARPGASNT